MVNQSHTVSRRMDQDEARTLTEEAIERPSAYVWGGAWLSTAIYGVVLYALFWNEEVTLAWGWRLLVMVSFALIPFAFIRHGWVAGRFMLGLSKQGLLYKSEGASKPYVLCPWSQVVAIQPHYDGEQDFVAIGLSGSTGDTPIKPAQGHVDDRDGSRWLLLRSTSKKRALHTIAAIQRYRAEWRLQCEEESSSR
jgi:hypothetical protein